MARQTLAEWTVAEAARRSNRLPSLGRFPPARADSPSVSHPFGCVDGGEGPKRAGTAEEGIMGRSRQRSDEERDRKRAQDRKRLLRLELESSRRDGPSKRTGDRARSENKDDEHDDDGDRDDRPGADVHTAGPAMTRPATRRLALVAHEDSPFSLPEPRNAGVVGIACLLCRAEYPARMGGGPHPTRGPAPIWAPHVTTGAPRHTEGTRRVAWSRST